MGMKDDIIGRLKEVLATGEYSITDTESIPGPGDNRVTFGNTGVRFWASTLFIDMRGSTKVLNQFKAHNVAKMHKAYLYTATTLIADAGGQIRSYNGDSILAFFPKNEKATTNKAVKTAMHIKWMLTQDSVKKLFEPYQHTLDFGVGIDHGQILCVKAGLGRNDNHNDLVWLGDAVNRAVRLSDKGRSPGNVVISNLCREYLDESTKLCEGKDMWGDEPFNYNDVNEKAWKTTYSRGVA